MTVDLTKLKKGDTVKFRCGGEAVVEWVDDRVKFVNYSFSFEYDPNDGRYNHGSVHLIDIIEIIPAKVESEVEKVIADCGPCTFAFTDDAQDYMTRFAAAIKADILKELGK